MRIIIATLPDRSASRVTQNLTTAGITCTLLSSSREFLEQGNTTILIGVPRDRVDKVISLIRTGTPGEGMAFVLAVQTVTHGVIHAFGRSQ